MPSRKRPDIERNKQVVRQMLSALNGADYTALNELVGAADHAGGAHPLNLAGAAPGTLKIHDALPPDAFPDAQFEEEVMIAEGDHVFMGFKWTGMHAGQMHGLAATNAPVTVFSSEIHRIEDGKVVEHTDFYTKARLEMLAKLGILLDDDVQGHLKERGII